MRSLHWRLGLLLALVPLSFASCADDDAGSVEQSGGDAPGDAGSASQAGSSSPAGTSHGGERGDAGSGSGGSPSYSDGGDASVGAGGLASEGGRPSPGNGGAPAGGAAGASNDVGAGHAGDAAVSGAGGEGGATSVELPPVVLFDAGPHDGLNFGGRLGLDQHCATAQQKLAIPGTSTHALISVSADDELRDLPAVYGLPTDRAFVGPTGKKVADDFADLLDGDIDQSLNDAEISSAQFWLTGSNQDGSVRRTCNGWTTNDFSQQVTGSYGYPGSVDSSWLTVTGGDVYCSASQYNVICVAY